MYLQVTYLFIFSSKPATHRGCQETRLKSLIEQKARNLQESNVCHFSTKKKKKDNGILKYTPELRGHIVIYASQHSFEERKKRKLAEL